MNKQINTEKYNHKRFVCNTETEGDIEIEWFCMYSLAVFQFELNYKFTTFDALPRFLPFVSLVISLMFTFREYSK